MRSNTEMSSFALGLILAIAMYKRFTMRLFMVFRLGSKGSNGPRLRIVFCLAVAAWLPECVLRGMKNKANRFQTNIIFFPSAGNNRNI